MADVQVDAHFDHHSPEYAARTWEIYRELRERCPVAHTPAHGGFWIVSDYEHVAQVARDDETFSSAHVVGDPHKLGITIPPPEFVSVPIEVDPPEFLGYRRVLNPFFSPAATKRWLEIIRTWTGVCIDDVIETGEFDIVVDLGNPVPALFTSEVLGLPLEDWRKYAEPMHTNIYAVPGTPLHDEAVRGLRWVIESLYGLVAEKRAAPKGDLLSELIAAEIDGSPLSEDVIVNMAFLIIAGGFDTTTSMIANILLYLDRNRDARTLLREEPDRIPLAIEEFLGYFTPTQALARTVTRDTELVGQRLRAGGSRAHLLGRREPRSRRVRESRRYRAGSLPEPPHHVRAGHPPVPGVELRSRRARPHAGGGAPPYPGLPGRRGSGGAVPDDRRRQRLDPDAGHVHAR
jgi:cytochrome P450